MTRLFLNNEEVAPPPPDISSLEQVIKHVEKNLLATNSVIRHVSLDGEPVDALKAQNDPTLVLGDLAQRNRIEIYTCTLKEIALDSIREADEYLKRVVTLTPSLADSFRDYPGSETFENLKQLCDGFYWMSLLLGKLEAVFHIDLNHTRVNGVNLGDHHQMFVSVLKQLVAAQEQEDFLLIADLLQFEILPMIPLWQSLFGDIAKSADGME